MEPAAHKPSRKFRALFICVAIIFWMTAVYLDFFCKTVTVYLIVIKQVCLLLTWVIPAIYFFIAKDKRMRRAAIIGLLSAVTITLRAKDEIRDYNHTLCHTQFGIAFNQRRRDIGIAQIPQDWQMEANPDTEIVWKGKDKAIGHMSKSVFIDSTCADKLEIDYYSLKPISGMVRSLTIAMEPVKAPKVDSSYYTYDVGEIHRRVTKNEADSILTAEKIQKDY